MIILENETDEGIEVLFFTDAGKVIYETPPLSEHEAEELADCLEAEADLLRSWAQRKRRGG